MRFYKIPIRSDAGACASFTGVNPIRTGPIPKLIHPSPEWIGPYPIRYRSLYIHYTSSSDPIQPDTVAYTSLYGMDPIRCGRVDTLCRNVSDPIRSDTEAYTSSPGVDPILSDPTPQLKPFFRNGSDLIRSDTGAYTSSYGMDPTLSDPIPELIHYLPRWNRSHPIRHPSLCISFRNVSGHILPDTELIHYFSEWIRILSEPIPKLMLFLPGWIRTGPIRSYPIPELIPILPGWT